jgi:hypothetical protein
MFFLNNNAGYAALVSANAGKANTLPRGTFFAILRRAQSCMTNDCAKESCAQPEHGVPAHAKTDGGYEC